MYVCFLLVICILFLNSLLVNVLLRNLNVHPIMLLHPFLNFVLTSPFLSSGHSWLTFTNLTFLRCIRFISPETPTQHKIPVHETLCTFIYSVQNIQHKWNNICGKNYAGENVSIPFYRIQGQNKKCCMYMRINKLLFTLSCNTYTPKQVLLSNTNSIRKGLSGMLFAVMDQCI